MKIVVTGAGALLGQGIIRSLLNSSLPFEVMAVDSNPLSAGLYWVPQRRLVPLAADPAYAARIEELIEETRPDAILIGTDAEVKVFAAKREEWERRYGTKIVVSSPSVVAIADDKYLTFKFFRDNGFDAPDSCLPGEEKALIDRVGFPLIVKPRIGARSIGVHLVRNRDELARAIQVVENPVIQEHVGTERDEYTAGTLTFGGKCLASIVMRRDLRDGNTYRAFVEERPEIEAIVRRMAVALGPYGPSNFQFRLDGERVKVFEINGRFSGTTPLRALAGFNEVEMVLRYLLRNEPVVQPTIEPITILRHWSEVVVRPSELLRAP